MQIELHEDIKDSFKFVPERAKMFLKLSLSETRLMAIKCIILSQLYSRDAEYRAVCVLRQSLKLNAYLY